MNDSECIPYHKTAYFSQLILDYVNENPNLRYYIQRFPKLEAFNDQIQEKATFSQSQRENLASALTSQYQDNGIELNEAIGSRIEALKDSRTFTVTTGHQLNILTGPLYFIYKILSTINLAEKLSEHYPDYKIQPIFWMATEDHDFEEISFINVFGGKLRWENDLKGAVGAMPTFGMAKVIDELEEHLGEGNQAKEIIGIFRKAYHEHDRLSHATRYIAHKLFASYGLLIIDGDDPLLKKAMIPHFQQDLFEEGIHKALVEQSGKLEEEYFAQVFPREINLFYLQNGLRERIEKQGEVWEVLNSDIRFDRKGLEQELKNHPERFSPNVVLRPLYQEVVLPNLAYIGGGGEIAYWLQLKSMFEHCEVPFPMPMVRNSVLFVEEKWQNRLKAMDLSTKELFQGLENLKRQFIKTHFPGDLELAAYDAQIESLFRDLEAIASITDKSMLGAVNAQRQKQLKGIANLRKKLVRAEKRRHQQEMDKLERVFYALFPNGGLQERHDNLAYFYAAYGSSFIERIKSKLDPLDFSFSIIKA